MLEKAPVDDNDYSFWGAWKHAKKREADAARLDCTVESPLSSILSLSREVKNRKIQWYAYRLRHIIDNSYAKFCLAYTLKDRSKLLPYQFKAVEYLCNSIVSHGAACDGSDTGLGKTFNALAVARDLKMVPAIVCKLAGIVTWERTAQYMGVQPLFVINWESAKSEKFQYTKKGVNIYNGKILYKWILPKNVLLIFDEAHSGANPESQNHALWMAAKGRPCLSLSATFADRPSRLSGLFNILGIMKESEYEKWLQSRGHFINRYNETEAVSSRQDMVEINRLLYPRYGYRLSYDEPSVSQFVPKAIIQTEVIYLGEKSQQEQNNEYQVLLNKIENYKKLGKQAQAMVADLRYRQATELRKAELLAQMAHNYRVQGLAVLVFVNFRETLSFLAKRLRTKSMIFGDQEKYNLSRKGVIDAFQNGRETIILSMVSAGGQSISLHDVHGHRRRITLIAPTYNPIDIKQIIGRTYRSNSKTRPIIKLVYAGNTVEEKVAYSVNNKLDNIKALNEGDLMERDLFGLIKAENRKGEE